ncbi:MAG: small ribosomal subunit Rsm22 family protein, partial [Bdellovibrionota bacterium]
PGTFLLVSIGYFLERKETLREIDLVGIDSDEGFLRVAEELARGFAKETLSGTAVRLSLLRRDLVESLPAEAGTGFDLIVAGNTLSEGFSDPAKAAGWLDSLANYLRPEGALVVIEPALKRTGRFLQQSRDALLALPGRRLHVFAPCLHEGPCPALARAGDWCHERVPWNPPKALEEIDRAAGLDKDTLTFSYLVLRLSSRSLKDVFKTPSKGLHRGRVVSDALPEKGKEGRVVCTEEGRWVHYEALERGTAAAARRLAALGRGEVALFPAGRPAGPRMRLAPDEAPERLEAPVGDD